MAAGDNPERMASEASFAALCGVSPAGRGVSRATMNRATAVLTEWDSRVTESPAEALQRQHREELAEARRKLQESRRKCRRLQDQLDAAAIVITTLLAEQAAMQKQEARRTAAVIPLGRSHAIHE